MDKCQEYLRTLIDSRYQNMDNTEKKKFEDNMNPDCIDDFNKMKMTLNLTGQQQVPDPGKEYWDKYWANLENRLADSAIVNNHMAWRAFLRLAAILLAGIFIGYLLFSAPEISDKTAEKKASEAHLASLNKKTAALLEDSKVLLLGIVNMDSPKEASQTIDFSFQKDISNDLLLQTADLKKQLRKIKNRRMVSLINELELILMQIANLEDDFDLPAIEMVKRGAENQSLLFKINMERLLMEAKEEHKNDKKTKKEL